MTTTDAVFLVTGKFESTSYAIEDINKDTVLEAWQLLIDTGLVWQLQGKFGRQAQRLIEDGYCEPADRSREYIG